MFASAAPTTQPPYVVIRTQQPVNNGNGYPAVGPSGMNGDMHSRSATHDISRTAFHVKHIGHFAQRLENSVARAFPNKGRTSQRYKSVQALLLYWGCDDLFVLPELVDLEKCLRVDYAFETDIFAIPSDNPHLELMMRIGQLIRDHESQDTLFIIYYGGHARIDESRQSTWCATREAGSPWLQWSAIQTLLERSKSDVLILLDCCAGAASATFPTGNSITETISASSWDAIAPDPGRYSFTNALIEVLQEWRIRIFSAAMLHAEVLARLKHPRPITINGKHFEARSTPVHFMMTSNHKAPSIELSRLLPVEVKDKKSSSSPLPPSTFISPEALPGIGRAANPASALTSGEATSREPTEDTPHVMISLALEDDQRLDINAWEQWLNDFPAMAKYVKIQGVFKSHSTLMLVSMPVMIWDLLPDDPATSFIGFIRSNNLAAQRHQSSVDGAAVPAENPRTETTSPDTASFFSGTTLAATEESSPAGARSGGLQRLRHAATFHNSPATPLAPLSGYQASHAKASSSYASASATAAGPLALRQMIFNKQQSQRRTTFGPDAPLPKSFAPHVERRLEEYYQHQPLPNDAVSAIIASNLGIEPVHLEVWFHHRRERDLLPGSVAAGVAMSIPVMILPADLGQLLDMSAPGQTLLLDTRPATEYVKSHLRGAINLRLPQSFIKVATLEMLEQSLGDRHSRGILAGRRAARCVVFYARRVEHAWECPSATSVARKLLGRGWTGPRFIVKGHYHELSAVLDRHITGEQLDPLPLLAPAAPSPDRWAQWLSRVTEGQGGAHAEGADPPPEAVEALEAEERAIEAEFRARCGDLHRQAQHLQFIKHGERDRDSFDAKAPLVEYLDRGLDKLRGLASEAPLPYASAYLDKMAARPDETEYVKVDKEEDGAGGRSGRGPQDVRRGSLLHKMFRRS